MTVHRPRVSLASPMPITGMHDVATGIDRTIAKIAKKQYRELCDLLPAKKARAHKIETVFDELDSNHPVHQFQHVGSSLSIELSVTTDPWFALWFLTDRHFHHINAAASLCRRHLAPFDLSTISKVSVLDLDSGCYATLIGLAIALAQRHITTPLSFCAVERRENMSLIGERFVAALLADCSYVQSPQDKPSCIFRNVLISLNQSVRHHSTLVDFLLDNRSHDITIAASHKCPDNFDGDLPVWHHKCPMTTNWRRDVADELDDYLSDKTRHRLTQPVLWWPCRRSSIEPSTYLSTRRQQHIDPERYKDDVICLLDRAVADVARREYDSMSHSDQVIGHALAQLGHLRSGNQSPDYEASGVALFYLLRYQYSHVNLSATCFDYLLNSQSCPNTIIDVGSGCLNALLGLVIAIGADGKRFITDTTRPDHRYFIAIETAKSMATCGEQLWKRFRFLVNDAHHHKPHLFALQSALGSWTLSWISSDGLPDLLRDKPNPRWHTEFHAIDPSNVENLPQPIDVDAILMTTADTQFKRDLVNARADGLMHHRLGVGERGFFFGTWQKMTNTMAFIYHLTKKHKKYQDQIKQSPAHIPYKPICYSNHHLWHLADNNVHAT